MQLTPAQRRFFIDPVQDPTSKRTQILVTEERVARGIHIDKVVTVKPNRANLDYRTWWITEEGDYVAGAPVNPGNIPYGGRLIAPGGDGWFWLGEPGRATNDGEGYLLGNMRRSDGRQMPNDRGVPLSADVPVAVRAAPWAQHCFPLPTDSDAVITAKLELAEQRWNHRRAKAEIIRQGMGRGWTDDLSELRENGSLPAATFGLTYAGQVLIPAVSNDISVRDNEQLEVLRRLVPASNSRTAQLVGYNVNVPLSVIHDGDTSVSDISMSKLRDGLREALGNYSAVPGVDYNLTPVLRSIA